MDELSAWLWSILGMNKKAVLEVKNLSKCYKKGKFKISALKQLSFYINQGEIFGLVGESGSGKSTVAKLITRLENPSQGEIFLSGREITQLKGKDLLKVYQDVQMVFQDPKASFNGRMRMEQSIRESFCNLRCSQNELDLEALFKMVDLKEEYASRYPHELSGGECQRAAIARAIAVHPRLLICDEATSALDVSAQAQIVDLLVYLKEKMDMAILFISHDLALISSICDRTGVLYQGELVEIGETRDVIDHPKADYTKKLIASVMVVEES